MKSVLSLLISILLVFGISVNCLAADSAGEVTADTVVETENLDTVVKSIVGELVGASQEAVVKLDTAELLEGADADGDGETTVGEVSQSLAKYIFINYDEIEGISQAIADASEYKTVVLDNGKSTVYIYVNIEEYPQLVNLDVFRQTVKKLSAGQGNYAQGDAYDLMSYQYIAGELALHTAVYALTVIFNTNEAGNSLYESAREAELNIDESRLPEAIIRLIGIILMDVIVATFYNIFQML